jgi:hypothetical protein
MVSRVAFALAVWHNKLLLIALWVGRSNHNADTALEYLVRKMLPRIVLERRVILEFLGPLKPRSCSPRGLSVTLASRRYRLCKRTQASTEWSVPEHQGNLPDLPDKILVDFDFGTQGKTAAQIMSM